MFNKSGFIYKILHTDVGPAAIMERHRAIMARLKRILVSRQFRLRTLMIGTAFLACMIWYLIGVANGRVCPRCLAGPNWIQSADEIELIKIDEANEGKQEKHPAPYRPSPPWLCTWCGMVWGG